MAKNYSWTKTRVRETLVKAFGDNTDKAVKLGDILALFESKSGGIGGQSNKDVKDAKGNVIARKCSVLGVYLPISQFGKLGDKFAYASKVGIKAKQDREKLLKDMTNKILGSSNIEEIKHLQADYKKFKDAAYKVPAGVKFAKTPEEAVKLFSVK